MAQRTVVGIGLALAVALSTVAAEAQSPNVAVYFDLYPTLSWRNGESGEFRWYDLDGHTSTVGFRMLLESGNRVLVSQRLQKYPGTGDPDSLDEYWIESTGSWRVGKQLLPFGQRGILRETGVAARLDTELLVEGLGLQIAYVDNGGDRARGVIGRVGDRAGASFAVGNHFGIQGSDFSAFQEPSEAVGRSRGWKTVLGADMDLPVGSADLVGEMVFFRDAEQAGDNDQTLSDLKASWFWPKSASRFTIGWARRWDDPGDYWRLAGEIPVAEKVTMLPYLRFDKTGFRNIGVGARVKF